MWSLVYEVTTKSSLFRCTLLPVVLAGLWLYGWLYLQKRGMHEEGQVRWETPPRART